MQISVLVEPIAGDGSRVRASGPFSLSAEGKTREEALQELRRLILDRLANGATLTYVQVPAEPHPLARWAGSWKPGDPFIEEWKRAVEEYRQEVEDDPDR